MRAELGERGEGNWEGKRERERDGRVVTWKCVVLTQCYTGVQIHKERQNARIYYLSPSKLSCWVNKSPESRNTFWLSCKNQGPADENNQTAD